MSKFSEEFGKEIMKVMIIENSLVIVKIKGVYLEKNLSLFERNYLKLNYFFGVLMKDFVKWCFF